MKKQNFFYALVSVCCIFVVLFPLFLHNGHIEQVEGEESLAHSKSLVQKLLATDTKDTKTGIAFTGDIMLARNVENLMTAYGSSYPLLGLQKHSDDMYLVGNFESAIPVTHAHTPSMGFSFSTKKENLEGLKQYGFTHMGVANNHSYDFGQDDFLHTKKILEESELHPFGDQRNLASSTVQFVEVEGETVALVGVFAVDVGPTKADISKLFKKIETKSTLQVAYVHFGTEYKATHSYFQENLAHTLIDAGADVVIGHHPHVVQDIEIYKNKVIFYSLGNFIFDQYFSKEVQEGLVVEMRVEQDDLVFTLKPVTSIGSRSMPRFMAPYERDTFLSELAKKSDTGLGVMIEEGVLRTIQ